jgi:glycosyltransferase involved in cell wall biosynthesis
MQYPKVIIIGETFRAFGGGGITLANLFKDWPPDKIGVVTDMIGLTRPDTGYSYYQLGYSEIKFPFPFHLMQTYFKSGPYYFSTGNISSVTAGAKEGWLSRFKKVIRPAFDKTLNRLGLFTYFYKIKLSQSLRDWILEFKPDIIYVQPFYHHMMRFGNLLYQEMKIPYAVHIMDDSVMYVNKDIFSKARRQRAIERDFLQLIKKASVRMCISGEMAEEYSRRYNESFLHFRNPIETEEWLKPDIKKKSGNGDKFRILYMGRTFPPYLNSLVDVCRAVDNLNKKGKKVSISISPVEKNPVFLKKTRKLSGIEFYDHVSSSEIPSLVNQFDLFLICEDFDREAQKYLRFSISTRASEGMISGVPVLIYAPGPSALSKYFSGTNSGIIVDEPSVEKLEEAILKIMSDEDFRRSISGNAVKTAIADSSSVIVRDKFRNALII